MKIALDLTALLPVSSGVDTFMKNLVVHLGKIDRENLYRVYINYGDRDIFEGALPDNFSIAPRCFRPRAIRLLFQQIWLPLALKAWGADVLHSPSFLMPFFCGRSRHVLTVHDMTFFLFPQYHSKLRQCRLFKLMVLKSIRTAHLLHVPSESTKRDLLQLLPEISPERVHVIPHGFSREFKVRPRGDVVRAVKRLGLPSRYILHVGTIEPRKNLRLLIESYKDLLKEGISLNLVLAGALGWGCDELLEKVETLSLQGKIHLTGHVDQENLPWVYAGADLFVYPSLYEGFGLPPLEAMACGVPTITSSTSSLGELYRGAALMVPPADGNALTEAMLRMLSDDALWDEYRRRGLDFVSGFSWEKSVADILKCYESQKYADL